MKFKSCLNLLLLPVAVCFATLSPVRMGAAPGPAHALEFDGIDDYVSASLPGQLTSNYTIAAWVYLDSGASFNGPALAVLTGEGANGCGSTMELLIHSSTTRTNDAQFLQFGRCNFFVGTLSTSSVPLLQWTHVAVTVSTNKQVSYFINGFPAGQWDASALSLDLGPAFSLGWSRNNGRFFDGRLGEVQVWNQALSRAQIQAALGRNFSATRSSLVLSYLFAEACGSVAFNSAPLVNPQRGTLNSGVTRLDPPAFVAPAVTTLPASEVGSTIATINGRLTAQNAPVCYWFQWGTNTSYGAATAQNIISGPAQSVSLRLPGLTPATTYHYRLVVKTCQDLIYGADRTFVTAGSTLGRALMFDGVDDYARIATAPIPTAGDFTIECWAFAPASASGTYRHIIAQGAQGNSFYFGTAPNGTIRVGDTWNPNVTFPVEAWHHLALVRSSANTLLYIDGILRATRGSAVPHPNAASPVIGKQFDPLGERWLGSIDDLRVWTVARTAEEIQSALTGPLTGTEPGLKAYWNFDEASGTNIFDRTGHGHDAQLINGPQRLASTVPTKGNYLVTTTADAGPGSLRDAVLDASALVGAHRITFAANLSGKTLRLTSGRLQLEGQISIDASALPGGFRIDGNHASRIFYIGYRASVTLTSLTLTNGYEVNSGGGGLYNEEGGTVTLNQCVLSGNAADYGGGLYNEYGTVTLNQCTLTGNAADDEGGGLYNYEGTVTVNQSTLIGNTARYGGGLYNYEGTVALNSSTVTGNLANNGDGGGLYNEYGRLTLDQSTLAGNLADDGGGIYNYEGDLTLDHSTLAGNVADEDAGGLYNYDGEVTLDNSIVAGNLGDGEESNIDGWFEWEDFNLTAGDPGLAPLGDYGGPTLTMPPLPGSRAIGMSGGSSFSTDQRGFPRRVGLATDLGAVESSAPSLRAYYTFDDQTAVDATGNSMTNFSGTYAEYWEADHRGRAASAVTLMEGAMDSYRLRTAEPSGNANFDLGLQDSFTVAVWIYSFNIVGDRWVLGNDGPGGAGTFFLGLRGGAVYAGFWNNDLAGNTPIPERQWTHLAFTYNRQGGQMAIYVNGRLDASEVGHPNSLGNHDLVIGWLQAAGNADYFQGRIDDLAIYAEPLAANQVAALASDAVTPIELLPPPELPLPLANGCVWSVREIYGHPILPYDLLSAEAIAHTSGLGTSIDYQSAVINLSDPDTNGDESGFITGDRPFRSNDRTSGTLLLHDDDDNFVLAARTSLVITEADDYTFGFSSDDGARLRLKGALFHSSTRLATDNPADPAHRGDTLAFPGNTGDSATLGVAYLTPGTYEVEFIMWEVFGGAFAEVFWARGAKTAFDGDFRPLGYVEPVANTAIITPFIQRLTNGAPARTVQFTAQVTPGFGATTYQWQFDGGPASGPGFVGTQTNTLFIVGATADKAGHYQVRIENGHGTFFSGPAFLIRYTNGVSDNSKPVLTLTNATPASLQTTDDVLELQGTVNDNRTNAPLLGVFVSMDQGPFQYVMAGDTHWDFYQSLRPGTNHVRIIAVDLAGNISAPITRTVVRLVTNQLEVVLNGRGTVAPNLDGQFLQVGRNYAMRAVPATGYLFSNWTGGLLCSGPVINFPMTPGLSLQANFVPSPFTARAGSYNGLLHEAGVVQQERSGFCNALVTKAGGYSGYVILGGVRRPISGQFGLGGFATNRISRTGTNALTLELYFDPNATGQLFGRLSDGRWFAYLIADLAPVLPKGMSAPQAGKYTWVWDEQDATGAAPEGGSVGAILVSAKGQATILATLADGTTSTQSVPVPTNGPLPFYLGLYQGKGAALGWLHLRKNPPQPVAAVSGLVNWFRPASPGSGLFASGFTVEANVRGSAYVSPTNNRVLNFTNAMADFGNDDDVDFQNLLALGAQGAVVNRATNEMKMNVDTANGLYSGTTVEPGTGRKLTFKGAVFQDVNHGEGWFLATNSSGEVFLDQTSANTSVRFDGADDYVSVTPTGSLSGTFTVELWARPNQAGRRHALFGSRSAGGTTFDFKLEASGLVHGDIGNGLNWVTTVADAPLAWASGVWVHIAYVVRPTGYTIYTNGSIAGSGTYAATTPLLYNQTNPLRIGDTGGGDSRLNGWIDEVRVWSTARTTAEIRAEMSRPLVGNESGLRGYWRFDRVNSGVTPDDSGHGFNATLLNGAFPTFDVRPFGQ